MVAATMQAGASHPPDGISVRLVSATGVSRVTVLTERSPRPIADHSSPEATPDLRALFLLVAVAVTAVGLCV